MIFMKVIRKNQIVIFVFALMLIAAGYMNYSKNSNLGLQISGLLNAEEVAGIGDAQLVSTSNVINEENELMQDNLSNTVTETTAEQTSKSITKSENSEYFENSRLERERMYSQMLETYQKVLESTSISEAQKSISQSEVNKINNTKNSIMIAENLIKNKGFRDVIIFVNDYSISVIIDAETLTEAEIAQIQNIITRELNAELEDVHVTLK